MGISAGKRIYFTLVAGLTVSGFLTVCALGQGVYRRKAEAKIAAAEERPEPLYTVREYEGRAAVFIRGKSSPERWAEVDLNMLPELDREALREGIGFDDEASLRAYLEDMES